jgi:hypothetical protein
VIFPVLIFPVSGASLTLELPISSSPRCPRLFDRGPGDKLSNEPRKTDEVPCRRPSTTDHPSTPSRVAGDARGVQAAGDGTGLLPRSIDGAAVLAAAHRHLDSVVGRGHTPGGYGQVLGMVVPPPTRHHSPCDISESPHHGS